MSKEDQTREPWLREVAPDEQGPSWLELYRKHILLAAGVVLVAFGGAIWYAYQAGSGAMGDAPLVKAAEGSIRHKPEDPGGMRVPDRDKLVYSRVNGGAGGEDVHLRPGPELPLDKPRPQVAEAPVATTEDGIPMVDPLGESAPSAAVVEDREAVPPQETPAPAAPASILPQTQPQTQSKPEAAPVAAKAAQSGGYMLQLGAFGSEAAANAAWDAARGKFPAAVGGLAKDIDVLNRDGKTLYRLRGASFADKAAADKACALLKAGNHACFVAK